MRADRRLRSIDWGKPERPLSATERGKLPFIQSWGGGSYPHWKPDGRPVHPIVVTFHEWFCFGHFFYKHLDKLMDAEFEKRGLDRTLLERHPYSVCSIADFEGLLTACGGASIDCVLSEKISSVHRQSILRGFLVNRYPGAMSKPMGTFEDGMDLVIDGPSRLTRK